jgi:hypothetical protein
VSGLGRKLAGLYWSLGAILRTGVDLLADVFGLVSLRGCFLHTINNQLRTGTDKGNLTV